MYQYNQIQQQIQRLRDEASTISNLAGQLQQAEMNNSSQLQQLQQKEVNASQQLQRLQYVASQLHQDINQINSLAQQMSSAFYQTVPPQTQGAFFNPPQYGGFGTGANQPGWSTQPGGGFAGGGQFFSPPAQQPQATQYEASRYGGYSPYGGQVTPGGSWGNIVQTGTAGQ